MYGCGPHASLTCALGLHWLKTLCMSIDRNKGGRGKHIYTYTHIYVASKTWSMNLVHYIHLCSTQWNMWWEISWASLSEPHTYKVNGGFICLHWHQAVYFDLPNLSKAAFGVRQSECDHRCARAAMDPTAEDSSSLSGSSHDKEERLHRREHDRARCASDTDV